MREEAHGPERVAGWTLAALLAFHLLVLRASGGFTLVVLAILLAGAVLRGHGVHAPSMLGRVLLVLGAVAVVMSQDRYRASMLLGELAGMTGALLLLRPVTPQRGLRVLFCLLAMLVAAILQPFTGVGAALIIMDVAAMLIVAEQVHRPPEVAVRLWVSVARSLRLVVPVGIIVTAIFWFFPSLSIYTQPVLSGFTGEGRLDPGEIQELARSHRTAFTAHFEEGQPLPRATDLYWRGRVLELNDGLRWMTGGNRVERARALLGAAPGGEARVWRYAQELWSNRGEIVPALDHAVFVEAKREGVDVAVLDQGAAVLRAVGGGRLSLRVASSPLRPADAPLPEIARGDLAVPSSVQKSAALQRLAARLFPGGQDVAQRLEAVGAYLRDSGFSYTLRPGHVPDLTAFLVRQRRGFCEHYAAAAANLLRLGGVPARLVTGYRGGEWNPWLRTLTVRDSHAHAWVEAWDAGSGQWLRFDPTDYVAPDFSARIAGEMDVAHWSWLRRVWRQAGTTLFTAGEALKARLGGIFSPEMWEHVQTALFMVMVLVALVWLVRNLPGQRGAGPPEAAARLLAELEHRASRAKHGRRAGETPLAWLARLEAEGVPRGAGEDVRAFAHCYEAVVYEAGDGEADFSRLRGLARRLRKAFRQ